MITARAKCGKEEKEKQFKICLSLPLRTLCVYSDRSRISPVYSAYGCDVYKDAKLITSG